ncbi:MAG TPA: hypothetical protein VGF48_15295 [Thermoanaerobaculia bacterium]|jgi:hypothetical protein
MNDEPDAAPAFIAHRSSFIARRQRIMLAITCSALSPSDWPKVEHPHLPRRPHIVGRISIVPPRAAAMERSEGRKGRSNTVNGYRTVASSLTVR